MSDITGVSAPLGAPAETLIETREAALRKVATEFEAMFVELLLQSAKLPLGAGESTSRIHGDMATSAWSGELGRTGGFGVADLLVRVLGRDDDTLGETAEGLPPATGAARYRMMMGDR